LKKFLVSVRLPVVLFFISLGYGNLGHLLRYSNNFFQKISLFHALSFDYNPENHLKIKLQSDDIDLLIRIECGL